MINNFTHPDYGPLTVHENIGRSYRCTKQDGTSVTVSTRIINKLTKTAEPVDIVALVESTLAGMPDDVRRVQVAKEIWHLADRYVEEKA